MSTVVVFSTVGVIMSTMGDIMMHVRGYHEYRGVMIPLKRKNLSSILSTSHFMIAILVSTFEIQ